MIPYKTVFGLGCSITIVSMLGLIIPPASSTYTSMLPNGNNAILTLLLGSMLMVFGWAAYFMDNRFKRVLIATGLALIAVVVIGIFYPDYFGLITTFIRPADLLFMLMTGVGYLLVALEVDRTMADLAPAPVANTKKKTALKIARKPRLVLLDVVKQVPRYNLTPFGQQFVAFPADFSKRAAATIASADSKMRAYSQQAGHKQFLQKLRQYYDQHWVRERAVPAPRLQ